MSRGFGAHADLVAQDNETVMKHLQDRKNRRVLTGNQHISLEQD